MLEYAESTQAHIYFLAWSTDCSRSFKQLISYIDVEFVLIRIVCCVGAILKVIHIYFLSAIIAALVCRVLKDGFILEGMQLI